VLVNTTRKLAFNETHWVVQQSRFRIGVVSWWRSSSRVISRMETRKVLETLAE
jgi:hypothetical protein